jgi:hypothetical protein
VVDNSAQANHTKLKYITPAQGVRYVRLKITNAGIDNYARIPEFEVWGSGGGGMNGNTPTGNNLALSAVSWPTDSVYSSSYAGDKAKDGVVSATSKWTSADTATPHWLAYDLGASHTVNGYIVRHAGAAGEPTYFNAKNFSIQTAASLSGPWTDDAIVDNSAQASVTTRSYNTPKSVRYVRLYITNAGIDPYARIPEFEVRGY